MRVFCSPQFALSPLVYYQGPNFQTKVLFTNFNNIVFVLQTIRHIFHYVVERGEIKNSKGISFAPSYVGAVPIE